MRTEYAPFVIDLYDGNDYVGYIQQEFDMTATAYLYGERLCYKDIKTALDCLKHR